MQGFLAHNGEFLEHILQRTTPQDFNAVRQLLILDYLAEWRDSALRAEAISRTASLYDARYSVTQELALLRGVSKETLVALSRLHDHAFLHPEVYSR